MREILPLILNLSNEAFDEPARTKLHQLVKMNPPDEQLKTGLHEILDLCVRYALATGGVIQTLNLVWKHYGGKPDDPAPWRNDPGHHAPKVS